VGRWLLPLLLAVTFLSSGPDVAAPHPFSLLPGWVWYPAWIGMVLTLVGRAVSFVVRRRHSTGTERAQLGWVVSAVLVGVYLVAVFVLGTVLPSQGQLAVAGSTLLAAALFNPLRREVQRIVDRRFNRSRFDAERLIEALSRRLSSEVDLAEVGRELQVDASHTMQPTKVFIWLKGESV
jgi:hypothetical protein